MGKRWKEVGKKWRWLCESPFLVKLLTDQIGVNCATSPVTSNTDVVVMDALMNLPTSLYAGVTDMI